MVSSRICRASKQDGSRCLAPPLTDGDYCFWHDPEHQDEVTRARQAGGVRRRREATLATAYEVGELASVDDLRRLVQIAVLDTLGLENTISRSRALGYLAQVGIALLEKGELANRLEALETAIGPRLVKQESPRKRSWWSR